MFKLGCPNGKGCNPSQNIDECDLKRNTIKTRPEKFIPIFKIKEYDIKNTWKKERPENFIPIFDRG